MLLFKHLELLWWFLDIVLLYLLIAVIVRSLLLLLLWLVLLIAVEAAAALSTDICFSTFCYFAARIKRYYVILRIECNANKKPLKNFFNFEHKMKLFFSHNICVLWVPVSFLLLSLSSFQFNFVFGFCLLRWLYSLFNVSPVFYIFFSCFLEKTTIIFGLFIFLLMSAAQCCLLMHIQCAFLSIKEAFV